jgi:uncharacterized iron-regulated protein
MASLNPTLSQSQLKFLESNFTVYDPDSGECYDNFSELPKCKVILIGETHYTHILHKIQSLFLKQFVPKDKPCCLMLETLPKGETIKAEEIPHWEDLPKNLTIQGSDIRHKITKAEYVKWKTLEHEYRDLLLSDKKDTKKVVQQIANLLNDAEFEISRSPDEILISTQVYSQLDKVWELDKTIMKKKESLIEKIQACNLGFNKTERHVTKSNDALAEQIMDATKEFFQVFAIWGEGHWYLGEKIFKKFDQKKVKFIVLIPNRQINSEVNDELAWRRNQVKASLLTIASKVYGEQDSEGRRTVTRTFNTLRVPECFKRAFLPQIQKLLKPEVFEYPETPVVEVSREDLSLFEKNNTIKFPPNRPIKFVGFNTSDCEQLQDVLDAGAGPNARILLTNCLDNMLALINKNVKSIDCPNLACSIYFENHLYVVQIQSIDSITITLSDEEAYCSPDHLLSEMLRKQQMEVKFPPNKRIHFRLNGEPFPEDLYDWLNGKTPRHNLQIGTKGRISYIKTPSSSGQPLYVTLSTNQSEGFSLVLLKRTVATEKMDKKEDT